MEAGKAWCRRAAGITAMRLSSAAHPTGVRDELPHRDRHRLLDIARAVHMPGMQRSWCRCALAADAANHLAPRLEESGATAMVSTF